MALINKIQGTCCRCGKVHDLDAYGSINVSQDPDLKEKVKDGSLFVWECEACGSKNLLAAETLYHDPDKKLMIWLLPLGTMASDQAESLGAQLSKIAESLDDYTLRRVSDVGSLIEKVNLVDAGLEDVVIEMCKYVTKVELAEKGGEKAADIMDAPFKFYRLQGADNQIVFSFPLDGQMQGVPVGFSVYEDCRGILQRNPAAVESLSGFAKVDADWLAQFFR